MLLRLHAVQLSILIGLLGCSHESDRANPLDPELTPPVTLSVATSDSAGTATLVWTAYSGKQPFSRYVVLRNAAQSTVVETLKVFRDAQETAFVDSTPLAETAYIYRVLVENAAGAAFESVSVSTQPLTLPPVRIEAVRTHSPTATARVTWTRYGGPDFAAYELRRAARQDIHVVEVIKDINDTTAVDVGLIGNTAYAYDVVVRTTTGQSAMSTPFTDSIHPLMRSWQIDVPEGTAGKRAVRLYARQQGIYGLISSSDGSRWVSWAPDDAVVTDWIRPQDPEGFNAQHRSAVVLSTDEMLWSMSDFYGTQAVVRLTDTGELPENRIELALPVIPAELGQQAGHVHGEVRLVTHSSNGAPFSTFSDVRVSDDGTLVFEEDFAFAPDIAERVAPFAQNGWRFISIFSSIGSSSFEWHREPTGGVRLARGGAARRLDPSWGTPQLQLSVMVGGAVSMQVGGDSLSSVVLTMSRYPDPTSPAGPTLEGWVRLAWFYQSEDGSVSAADSTETMPLAVFGPLPYGVTVSLDEGRPRATVRQPRMWSHRLAERINWASLASFDDDNIAHTAGATALAIDGDGNATELGDFSSPVSETRIWQPPGELPQAAVCLPQENVIRLGEVFRESQWSSALRKEIGPRLGVNGDALYYPVSMDVGPEGRLYVLDAGNARVVVFDAGGGYITQFGVAGSGAGEFDFGGGEVIEAGRNFAGSIAVDDDGFIYVADVGNRRIQKFAP